jgi:hypothetical protein
VNARGPAFLVGCTLALATWAAPSQASCFDLFEPPGAFTFAGQTVPLNAELAVMFPGAIGVYDGSWIFVTTDGATVDVTVPLDTDLALLEYDAVLSPGRWRFLDSLHGYDLPFDVSDVVDETPPAAPTVTVGNWDQGLLFWYECRRIPHRDIEIEINDDDVAYVLINGVPAFLNDDIDAIGVYDEDVVSWDVVAVDFAGNESDVVTVAAPGGCASVPTAPLSVFGLALLARRRPRRR